MKSMLALFFLLGSAFAGYPLSFPTNTASTPEGITYWSGNGGGYFVGSAALGTVNWVSTTGSYVPNVLVDTNASDAGYTVFGLYVVTVVSGHDILLAARANLLATPVPISAVTAFDLGEGTFGQKLWTVYLGAGWANDLTLDSNGDAYVTDTKLGKIWRLNAPDLTAPTTEIFASSTAFLPNNATNLFSVGINGIRACPTSSSSLDEYIVTGIADGGVSRTRLYCVNTVNGSDITPITFANAAAYPLINYAVFDGMEFFPTGELMFTGAPAGAGIITAYGGDFCQPGTTYNITMFKNISQAINNGNLLTTVTWNCDFNIMATLGTSFNLFLQIPQPPSYGIYVANGTLPYSGSNFAPGNDCSAAVNVIPGPVVPSLYYDMLCFMQSRVTIPAASSCGTGFGIWFRINVTGLTGVWDFTTRTDFTGFDNYLSLYSTCPTTCAYVPNDPYIDCQDDVSNFVGGCGVSTSSRCSAIALNLSAAAYTEIYAVINFYSSPTIAPCVTGTTTTQPNYFTTFAVVPHDVVPPNPSTPFPNQICDPCVVVPTSSSAATGSTNTTGATGTTAPTATGTATTAATATTSATGTATTANTNPTGNTANTNPTGNTANTNPTGTTNSNPATSASPSPSGSGTTTSSTSSSGNDNAGSSDSVRASLFF